MIERYIEDLNTRISILKNEIQDNKFSIEDLEAAIQDYVLSNNDNEKQISELENIIDILKKHFAVQ